MRSGVDRTLSARNFNALVFLKKWMLDNDALVEVLTFGFLCVARFVLRMQLCVN